MMIDDSLIFRVSDTLGLTLIIADDHIGVACSGTVSVQLGGIDFTMTPRTIFGKHDNASNTVILLLSVAHNLCLLVDYQDCGDKVILLIDRSKLWCDEAVIVTFMERYVITAGLTPLIQRGAIKAKFVRPSTTRSISTTNSRTTWSEVKI